MALKGGKRELAARGPATRGGDGGGGKNVSLSGTDTPAPKAVKGGKKASLGPFSGNFNYPVPEKRDLIQKHPQGGSDGTGRRKGKQ